MTIGRDRTARARETIRGLRDAPPPTLAVPDLKKGKDALLLMERQSNPEIIDRLDSGTTIDAPDLLLTLEILDLLSIGFVVCNVSGQMLTANRTAKERIQRRDGLQVNSKGELCARRRCAQSGRVRLEATRITTSNEFRSGDSVFAVPRGSGKRALTVLVRSYRSKSKLPPSELPAALVLIFDSSLSARTTELELKHLYGLTATEARIANMLTDGKALADCCRELGISRATVCTHLRRLFKKTRVRRQSELVSLLLRSIGFARLGTAGLTKSNGASLLFPATTQYDKSRPDWTMAQ
jgi:DNA-binding CsgD family transcriptional regulator